MYDLDLIEEDQEITVGDKTVRLQFRKDFLQQPEQSDLNILLGLSAEEFDRNQNSGSTESFSRASSEKASAEEWVLALGIQSGAKIIASRDSGVNIAEIAGAHSDFCRILAEPEYETSQVRPFDRDLQFAFNHHYLAEVVPFFGIGKEMTPFAQKVTDAHMKFNSNDPAPST